MSEQRQFTPSKRDIRRSRRRLRSNDSNASNDVQRPPPAPPPPPIPNQAASHNEQIVTALQKKIMNEKPKESSSESDSEDGDFIDDQTNLSTTPMTPQQIADTSLSRATEQINGSQNQRLNNDNNYESTNQSFHLGNEQLNPMNIPQYGNAVQGMQYGMTQPGLQPGFIQGGLYQADLQPGMSLQNIGMQPPFPQVSGANVYEMQQIQQRLETQAPVSSTKVKLSDLPPSVNQKDIKRCLSKKKFNNISEIDIAEEMNTATCSVICTSTTASETLRKGRIKLMNKTVHIGILSSSDGYSDTTSDTDSSSQSENEGMETKKNKKVRVKISPVSKRTIAEDIQKFCEKNSIGPIENITRNSDCAYAILEFSNEQGANDLVSRCPITLKKKEIRAEIIRECTQHEDSESNESGSSSESEREILENQQYIIEISDIHPDTPESEIKRYCETKIRGGTLFPPDKKLGKVRVSFENEEDMKKAIMRVERHTLEGITLSARQYIQPSKLCPKLSEYKDRNVKIKAKSHEQSTFGCIMVSKLPASVSRSALESYFGRSKNGGGKIKYIAINRGNLTAKVVFEDQKVVNSILQKTTHLIDCKKVKIEPMSLKDSVSESDDSMDKNDEELEPSSTVEITGITDDISDFMLGMWFESKKSGGDEIEKMDVIREEGKAIVKYKDHKVANRVSSTRQIIEGIELLTRVYTTPPPEKPKPTYKDRVFVKNIDPKTSESTLHMYFELISGAAVKLVKYSDDKESAIILFDEEIEFTTLESGSIRKPLEYGHVIIWPVPVSACVFVCDVDPTTSLTTITLYFENARRSGGGNVVDTKFLEEKCFLVFFEDPEVAEQVCSRIHKVDGKEIRAEVYYECLHQCEKFRVPEPLDVKMQEDKLEYVLYSKESQRQLEMQLSNSYANIHWPNNPSDNIQIECTLTKDANNANKLAKSWKNETETIYQTFCSSIVIGKYKPLIDVWDEMKQDLDSLYAQHDNRADLLVKMNKDSQVVSIAGRGKAADIYLSNAKKIINQKEETFREKKKLKTETIPVQSIQKLKLLEEMGLLDSLRNNNNLDVCADLDAKEIKLTGLPDNVEHCMKKIYEAMLEIVTEEVENVNVEYLNLLHTKQAEKHIKDEFKKKGKVITWESDKVTKMKIFAMSSSEAKDCMKYIQSVIVDTKFDEIPIQSKGLLRSSKLDEKIRELQSNYPGLAHIKIHPKKNEIKIICFKHVLGSIREVIQDFFATNTLHQIVQTLSTGQATFVATYCTTSLNAISNKYQDHYVKVELNDTDICINGTKEGIKKAKKDVETLVQSLTTKRHQLIKQSTISYIQTPQGHTKIKQIENNRRCVIETGSENEDSLDGSGNDQTAPSSAIKEFAVCSLSRGKVIYTQWGCMTDLEAVDIFVNAANQSLDHQSGLAKNLVDSGGSDIQQECRAYVNKNGMLEDGEIYCSKPGSLKCKIIIHAVCPIWRGGQNDEKDCLQLAVNSCLIECDRQKLSSIAIPGLATGAFGFPKYEATKAIVEEINKYFEDSQNSRIKTVHLCDIDDKIVNMYTEVLIEIYGEDKVTRKQTDGGWKTMDAGQKVLKQKSTRQQIGRSRIPVTLVKGQIANQQVDVIVNTTSSNLDLRNGSVSKSLLGAAGPEIQKECYSKYPNGIRHEEVAMTGGHDLNCSLVFHVSLPKWNPQTSDMIEKLILDCLNMAENDGVVSIAFPALGTGILKYPRDKIAEIMYQSVESFFTMNPQSSIKDIQFVIYYQDAETIKAFEKEETKRCAVPGSVPDAKRGGDLRKTRAFTYDPGLSSFRQNQAQASIPDTRTASLKGLHSSESDSVFNVGNIKFCTYQGDITKAKTDSIVNSTDWNFDEGGAVTQALLRKGGRLLRKEMDSNRLLMQKKGYVVTTGGELQFRSIIHVASQDTDKEWKNILVKVLKKAEEKKVGSLAVPALGTGYGRCDISELTRYIIDAMLEHSNNSKGILKEVHMIIYDKTMLSACKREVKQYLSTKSIPNQRGVFGRVYDYFTGSGKEATGNQVDMSMPERLITLYITSDKKRDTENAIKDLEDEFESENKKKVFKDPIIKSLTASQQEQIQDLGTTFGIDIKVEVRVGRIQVQGMDTKNLFSAYDVINDIIREAERMESRKKEAKRIAAMVEWYFIEITQDGQELSPYGETGSLSLETAYQDKKDREIITSDDGARYIVDFKEMKEYPEQNPNDTVTVIRKEKFNKAITSQKVPDNWSPMDTKENITVIPLESKDQECQEVSKLFTDSIASSPSNLVKVERIQNKTLFHQYIAKKIQIESANPTGHVNERILFHGTADNAISSVNLYGFNRSYCGKNATYFGEGVYFAAESSYSARDTYSPADSQGNKHMYVCRVLTGEFTKGATDMRVPPSKPSGGGLILYDSVVNDINNPTIFVIFNDTQAYPEYLITFN